MRKIRKYRLKGLDCASCAVKIEEELKKQDGVKFAAVNFSTSELVVDAQESEDEFYEHNGDPRKELSRSSWRLKKPIMWRVTDL